MATEYTGRIRYRQETIKHLFFPNETVLILQVEKLYDHGYDFQKFERWEDARVEDISLMSPED